MSGSVFMTVAIALERYAAVHYPLNYNQVYLAFSELGFQISVLAKYYSVHTEMAVQN